MGKCCPCPSSELETEKKNPKGYNPYDKITGNYDSALDNVSLMIGNPT
jgi:hypothetical protein